MNTNISCVMRQSSLLRASLGCLFLMIILIKPSHAAMTVAGPISMSSVTVTGDISVSSMTINQLTVSNKLNSNGNGLSGRIIQMKFSTATESAFTASTFTAVPGLSQSITLSSATSFVRISLTGAINVAPVLSNPAFLTIYRDGTTNLGDSNNGLASLRRGFSATSNTGIVIADSPGDTNAHTYQAFIRLGYIGTAVYPYETTGFLILEEISR